MMKIRLLTLLIVCLSLHTTKVFAHPKPDGMSDAEHAEYHHEELRKVNEEINNRLDRVENDIKKLKNQGQSTSNRVTKIEGQRKGEKKIKDAQTNSLFTFVTIVIIVAIAVYLRARPSRRKYPNRKETEPRSWPTRGLGF